MWDFDCGSFDNFQSYKSRQINPDLLRIKSHYISKRSFNRINSDRSIPTGTGTIPKCRNWICFNRINPSRLIPTSDTNLKYKVQKWCFNRINQTDQSRPDEISERNPGISEFQSYQSRQIIPDDISWLYRPSSWAVSIVSIQTDQSRRELNQAQLDRFLFVFQSYQSKQINPDTASACEAWKTLYSFNRINPDRSIPTWCLRCHGGNNKPVSIVSIQTDQSRLLFLLLLTWPHMRVSIVSIQADQSRRDLWPMGSYPMKRFNRINPDRSIPTRIAIAQFPGQREFQSYQFRQINPDKGMGFQEVFIQQVSIVSIIVSIQTDQSRL